MQNDATTSEKNKAIFSSIVVKLTAINVWQHNCFYYLQNPSFRAIELKNAFEPIKNEAQFSARQMEEGPYKIIYVPFLLFCLKNCFLTYVMLGTN